MIVRSVSLGGFVLVKSFFFLILFTCFGPQNGGILQLEFVNA